ncbi:hypothetical protein JTE90_029404 [Oedothorax gibbosus]|uniref:Uncharacterized protein n=1 Tax=Oedothorax gibbosus TaxID=931172 RepID=A0AAV6UB10_9ARAC|nr:hypothetical protein JTE90_029404 [Oedothorax gibbosus]
MPLLREYEGVKTTLENQPAGIQELNLSLVRVRLMAAEALLEDSRRENPQRPTRGETSEPAAFAVTSKKTSPVTFARREDMLPNFLSLREHVTHVGRKDISSGSVQGEDLRTDEMKVHHLQ